MVFPAVQFTGYFPEAHGLVLLDPVRLDRFLGGEAAGHNLLELLSTTKPATPSREGIAIPLTGLAPALHTVLSARTSLWSGLSLVRRPGAQRCVRPGSAKRQKGM